MGESEIIRKDGQPFAFKGPTVEFIRCGKKKNPQLYTPSHRFGKLRCKHVKR